MTARQRVPGLRLAIRVALVAVAAALAAGWSVPPAAARAVPTTTGAATDITATAAVLNGTVAPDPCPSGEQVVFLYGPTTNYGSSLLGPIVRPSADPVPVSARTVGLLPDTTYHFRVTATDSCGSTGQIDDASFTTLPAPEGTGAPATMPPARKPVVRTAAVASTDCGAAAGDDQTVVTAGGVGAAGGVVTAGGGVPAGGVCAVGAAGVASGRPRILLLAAITGAATVAGVSLARRVRLRSVPHRSAREQFGLDHQK